MLVTFMLRIRRVPFASGHGQVSYSHIAQAMNLSHSSAANAIIFGGFCKISTLLGVVLMILWSDRGGVSQPMTEAAGIVQNRAGTTSSCLGGLLADHIPGVTTTIAASQNPTRRRSAAPSKRP